MDSGQRSIGLALAEAQRQFDEAVNDEADPGVDYDAEVETKWFVAGSCGEVRHEDKEVEPAAD